MKEYKLPTLNAHYENLLEYVIYDEGKYDYLSVSQIKKVRPIYNRISNNPVWKEIADRGNNYELIELAKHIVKGEIIASPETFLWYLLDRYSNRIQVNLKTVAENEECVKWNYQSLIYWLNGLSIKYSHLINFSPTHDLNSITFVESYNNQ